MTYKQTILIAGATGSIGGGAAVALARRGATVVLLGRSRDKLDARASLVRKALSEARLDYRDADVETLIVDLSSMESVRDAAAEATHRFPVINGLILSVGVYVEKGPNILPSGDEVMFATNVMGPFLFTQLLSKRLEQSNGLVLHVIAPFHKAIDWDDLQSISNHRTMTAFNRTKTCNRVIAGELARRYAGRVSSVAFNPTFVIDKSDPELRKRWPSGLTGLFWRLMTMLLAKPTSVAGEPIANLMLSHRDRSAINGALFQLDKRIDKPDDAMNDEALGKRLWDALELLTGSKPHDD